MFFEVLDQTAAKITFIFVGNLVGKPLQSVSFATLIFNTDGNNKEFG